MGHTSPPRREWPETASDLSDYSVRSQSATPIQEPFRALARELGESPASLAHRYALSMAGVDTVVLGVKNRDELRECLEAEDTGPLASEVVARIDETVRMSGT